MEIFVSFDNSLEYSFFFSKNHFIMLFISLFLVIFFTMIVTRKNLRSQKFFAWFETILLVLLEAGRIVWRYFYLKANGESLDFFNVVALNFFVLALWISILLLFTGLIVFQKNEYSARLNFVFSIAMLIAMMSMIYPVGVNTHFEFYHVYNLIYLFERTAIITLGLVFAVGEWISVAEFFDMWNGVLCLCLFGAICVAVGYIAGWQNNLLYVNSFPVFDQLEIYIGFPFHYLLLGIFAFALQNLCYAPFRIYQAMKLKKQFRDSVK